MTAVTMLKENRGKDKESERKKKGRGRRENKLDSPQAHEDEEIHDDVEIGFNFDLTSFRL